MSITCRLYSAPAIPVLRLSPKKLVARAAKAHKRGMELVRARIGVLLRVLGALAAFGLPIAAQADEPLAGVIVIVEREEDRVVIAKSITGNDGSVRVYIPSGRYRIVAGNAADALAKASVRRNKAAPPNPDPAAAAPADRTASITVQVTAFGTVRRQRLAVGGLSDGMEAVLFETEVSSPITIVIKRTEEDQ
jgi:hypothetical protein